MTVFTDMANRIETKDKDFKWMNPQYAFLINAISVYGSGKELSECFNGWVSSTQLVLIKTGEQSGQMTEALASCVELEKKLQLISKAVKSSMRMPVIAVFALVGLLYGAYTQGVPIMLEVSSDVSTWGSISTNFKNLSAVVGQSPFASLLIVFLLGLFYKITLPNLTISSIPSIRNILDKYFPFYDAYRRIQASIFLKSLATLLASGVRVNDALELILKNSNRYVSYHVNEMKIKIGSGKGLESIFETPFLGEDGEDLSDMAKGDDLEGAIREVSEESIQSVIEELPMKLNIVGKLMIIGCIGVVLFGVASLYEIIGNITG
ncbi:type II secretion system F family protein [Photobacterium kishitanii]|nr:type II secretion system F family protein [Photobacterium kishitanii]